MYNFQSSTIFGRAHILEIDLYLCYMGKIKIYMVQMDPSFCLDLIVKVVTVTEAAFTASAVQEGVCFT